jgi:hypothetical protein
MGRYVEGALVSKVLLTVCLMAPLVSELQS